MFQKSRAKQRRGITGVQLSLMLGLITLVILSTVASLGTNASTEMMDTATRVGDPSLLPGRFSDDYEPIGGGGKGGGTDGGGDEGGDEGVCP